MFRRFFVVLTSSTHELHVALLSSWTPSDWVRRDLHASRCLCSIVSFHRISGLRSGLRCDLQPERVGGDPVDVSSSRSGVRSIRHRHQRRDAAVSGTADSRVLRHHSVADTGHVHRTARTTGLARRGTAQISCLASIEFTPTFKTTGDGTTSRGPVTVHSFTPFSDPDGYVDASFITDGPVYARTNYYPPPAPQIAVDPAIKSRQAPDRRGLRRRVDCADGRRVVLGRRRVRTVSAALRRAGTSC